MDLLVPNRWTGDVHRLALGVDGHGHWHVLHVELVDGFHTQFGKGHHARLFDRLGDQVELPKADVGDLISLFLAGAYGKSASPSAFLGHPEALELIVG